VVQKRV